MGQRIEEGIIAGEGTGVDRRMFLRGAAVAAGAVAVGAVGVATSGEDADAKRARPLSWQGRNLLRIPPIVDVAASADPFELMAVDATVPIGGGQVANAQTYNGMIPGPIFLARPGDTAKIHLTNQLADHHITHWHGLVVNHQNDGHPINEVATNGTYSYEFPIVQRASLNFYHPHTHGLTGEQVALGMAGGFLIKDDEELALPLPPSDREIPLVIRDATLDNSHNMMFSGTSKGFFGDFPMVNGTKDPYLKVEAALYRFRVVCGTNSRVLQMKLSDDSPFTIIGNDGGLLAAPAQVSQITMSPGERFDLLVDFSGKRGTKLMLQDVTTGWDALGFLVAYAAQGQSAIPATLSTITPLSSPVRTRTFTFDGMTAINGLTYDINRIDFQVPFGETERWVFSTGGNGPHPVHIHGTSFQVQSRTGGRGQLYPWEAGWKDTVLLQDAESVEVLIRFDGYRGEYLIHCHQLGHEDGGMMSNFEVI